MARDSLTESAVERIDACCDRFEASWKAGTPPDFEPFLADIAGVERIVLFEHLLELDIDYRTRRISPPTATDYQRWLAEFPEVIAARLGSTSQARTHRPDPIKMLRDELPSSRSGSRSRAQDGQFLPGTILANRFRIVALLGRGGMGEVYRAEDLRLGENVALKFLPPEFARDPTRLSLFYDEVRLSRGLSHPGICRVHDLYIEGAWHFLSMEYIDGENLQALLRRIGRIPESKAIELARQMASGLAAAHQSGIVHRDLKPANVMIDSRGHARITDFGLACLLDGRASATETVGTPIYMAPETFLHGETNIQSDVYSLGLILFEMCVGRRFCRATTLEALRDHHEHTQSPEMSELAPGLDPLLAKLIATCLERDPAHRPASAQAVLAMLPGGDPLAAALAAGETPSPETVAAAGSAPALPGWQLSGLVGLIVAGLVAVLLLSDIAFRARDLRHPPAVLAHRAREYLSRWGYTLDPGYEAWGWSLDRTVRHRDAALTRADAGLPINGSGAYFWYRWSPEPMAPRQPDWTGDDFLSVDERRPAFEQAGMIRLRLDPRGQLLDLQVLPSNQDVSTQENDEAPPAGEDRLEQARGHCDELLRSAGYSDERLGDLTQIPPRQIPPGFADMRLAIAFRNPTMNASSAVDSPRPVVVEYAEYAGKPVFFQSGMTGENTRLAGDGSLATGQGLRVVLLLAWMPLLLGAAITMAWRNWHAGRGDKRGALRVAAALTIIVMLHWLLGGTHVAARQELDLLFTALAGALLLGAIVWTGYLAVEPSVRRYRPKALVSWTRLVAGRVRDPLIGRDVLVGIAAGLGAAIGKLSLVVVPELCGWTSLAFPNIVNLTPLLGIRVAGGELAAAAGLAVPYALFFQFLFLLLLRLVLRRWVLAAIAFVVFLSLLVAIQFQPLPLALAITASEMTLTAVLFLRVGLLPVVTMHFTRLLCKWPLTWDLSLWYSDTSLVATGILVSLAVWSVVVLRRTTA